MRPTWKKIYHANGRTEVFADGKLLGEIRLFSIPPPDMLTDRATAEKFIAARPDIFGWWLPNCRP